MLIGLAIKLLSALGLTEKAAKIAAPIALFAVLGLGVWLLRHDAYMDGKKDLKAEISEKVAEAREKERELYLEREKVTRASYETAIQLVAQARQDAPQVIREIRDAPQTSCSSQPIGDYRLRLLNAAITGAGSADSPAG